MFTKTTLLACTAALGVAAAPSSTFPKLSRAPAPNTANALSIFDHPLYVENAPQHPQPYLTSAYSSLQAVGIGNYVFRFSATRNSTGNAFSVVLTSGSGSPTGGTTTTPHWHQRHYETFYPLKGSMQVWAKDNSRFLAPGDLAVVPENVTHDFQIRDPDTLMVGIQAPGGFEDFFALIGTPLTNDPLDTPFDYRIPLAPAQAPPPQAKQAMENIGDFYAAPDYVPRTDLVNGSAPASNWHSGANTPAQDPETPFFMARNWGPFFLNDAHGLYQVVQPLVTPKQSGENNFTMSTLSLSLPLGSTQGHNANNGTGPALAGGPPHKRSASSKGAQGYSVPAASMFIVEEGRFVVTVAGQPPALLIPGDQLFVPPGTEFTYSSAAALTKVLYASGGHEGGLDTQLMAQGKTWKSPMFPLK